MRDQGASAESSAVSLGGSFPLPGADTVAKAWSERPAEGVVIPEHPEKARTIAAAMLVLGAALLLFVPLGGALLIVSGGIGLAISMEGPAGRAAPPITLASPPPANPRTRLPSTIDGGPAATTTPTGLSSMVGQGRESAPARPR